VTVRILLDEHLKPSIAHDLTALGFDVVCARDRGLANRRVPDWQLMDYCINDRLLLNQVVSLARASDDFILAHQDASA
jgi:predicted nuclease of predicted toxin-antitoxin system